MSTASGSTRPGRVFTPQTITLVAVLVALTALFGWLSSLMYADALSEAAYTAAYWYGTGLQVVFAVVIVLVALGIGLHQHVGKQWLFVGLGVVAYALGDITWTILDLHMGLDPYPSIADIFYTLEYVFFFTAIVLAIRSYRALTDLQTSFNIVPIGTADAGAWHYAFTYDIVARAYPDILEQSRFIGEVDARQKLAETYLRSVGAAQLRDITLLFQWSYSDIDSTIDHLVQSGVIQRGLELPKFHAEWIALTSILL